MLSSSWLRRHQKIVYIVMIFAMCVWGIGYSAMEMLPKKAIGEVYGRKITQEEFVDMVGRWQRLFFSQAQESIIPLMWKQLTYLEEAKRMRLDISSNEIENGLRRIAFQVFGQKPDTDTPRLEQFLCNTFKLNQEQLERTLWEALLIEKLDSMMKMSTKMTADEIWQRYALDNEKVKFKALTLRAKDFAGSVSVTDVEIKAFYEKHKNNLRSADTGEPGYKFPDMVKLECILAQYDELEKQIIVTEDEINTYYEENKDVQYKISDLEQSMKDKGETSDEGLEQKQETTEGGKESANEPEDVYTSLVEVRDEIKKTLARQKAEEMASEIINKVDEEIYDSMDQVERPNFMEIARKYNLTYLLPKSKSSGSEFLTEENIWEILPGSDQIVQVAFDRGKFEPTVPMDYVKGKVVFQVIDKRLSAAAPFDDVKGDVIRDLKTEKGLQKAKEIAEKHINENTNATFEALAKSIKEDAAHPEMDIPTCETDYISRPIELFNKESRYIEALKEDRPNVAKKAFEIKPGEFGIAIENTGEKACYILSLVDKKPADKELFEKTKETLIKRYLFEKQEAFIAAWQNEVNKHLEIYTKFK